MGIFRRFFGVLRVDEIHPEEIKRLEEERKAAAQAAKDAAANARGDAAMAAADPVDPVVAVEISLGTTLMQLDPMGMLFFELSETAFVQAVEAAEAKDQNWLGKALAEFGVSCVQDLSTTSLVAIGSATMSFSLSKNAAANFGLSIMSYAYNELWADVCSRGIQSPIASVSEDTVMGIIKGSYSSASVARAQAAFWSRGSKILGTAGAIAKLVGWGFVASAFIASICDKDYVDAGRVVAGAMTAEIVGTIATKALSSVLAAQWGAAGGVVGAIGGVLLGTAAGFLAGAAIDFMCFFYTSDLYRRNSDVINTSMYWSTMINSGWSGY
jgi:hypothetical protein